jgi:hypothetical protein
MKRLCISQKGENEMANMAYCRFRNTLQDLRDCYDNMNDIDDPKLDPEEKEAIKKIITICKRIVKNYGEEN